MSGPGDLDSDDFDTEDWEERAELDDAEDTHEGRDDDELANCGMMHDGTCTAAGSEDCDFDCPLGPIRNPGAWR